MKVASWASRHARSLIFLVIILVVGGAVCSTRLPVSLFPRVNFPRIRANVSAGDRPVEQMTVQVTRPLEEVLRAIPGVRSVESRTSRGAVEVWLTFDWGEDMAAALLRAQAQANQILPKLPEGATFEVRQMDPTVFSTISYSVTSKRKSLPELRDWAQFELAPVLATAAGVARVDVQGGAVEEWRVDVDPRKLLAQGLTEADVTAALANANVLESAGVLEDHYRQYLVVTDARLKTRQDIAALVIRSSAAGVVRLSDVATVRDSIVPPTTIATADGQPAVLFDVYQQPGANTVAVAKAIQGLLSQEEKRLPADSGITITKWYDQSDLILSSAKSVRDAVLIGVGLAALVLLLFLRNWRITLVAAITVPSVLAITALLLYLLNSSFNIMTLGGMAAAVGLIIDDAIVMCEHIVRRLHGGATREATETVQAASNEFSKPLAGSSLSTIVIHIPPAFLVGVAGAFFASLSLSMASSLIISFFIAWLVIPVLAGKFLRRSTHRPPAEQSRALSHRIYAEMMWGLLRVPWLVVFIAIGLVAVGYLTYTRLPSGFMPSMDEGGFIIDYVTPPGTSLTETDRILKTVENVLHDTPEVQTFSRRTGFAMGGDFSEANSGDFFVQLKPLPRRDIDDVMSDVRTRIERSLPGVDFELSQLMEDIIGDITGRPEPVVINLFSEDEQLLQKLAPEVKEKISKIDGIVEPVSGIVPAGDSLNISVDRTKASLEGVDPSVVSKQLSDELSGDVATQVQVGEKLVGVRVWLPLTARQKDSDIAELPIRAPDGHVFPLKKIATIQTVSGEPEINRVDLTQVVSVTARIEGRDLGSTVNDVRAALDAPGTLPTGVRYTLGGLYEQQQIAFRGLLIVIIAATTLVLLLLLFLYESFRIAASILITTLLAIAVVFFALWLTGTELNISSLMGMVMIVGNVTEVAIFYCSELVDFPHEGSLSDRLIVAGENRMRAIVMTTVAAILALLPLALNIGHGSSILQPLSIAIIAGLIAQLPLVLIVLPMLLRILRPIRSRIS